DREDSFERPKTLLSMKRAINYVRDLTGKNLSISTIYRWVNRGLDGTKLRTVDVGGEMYTSEEWVWEFFNRRNPSVPPSRRMTPARRRREFERTNAELAAAGW